MSSSYKGHHGTLGATSVSVEGVLYKTLILPPITIIILYTRNNELEEDRPVRNKPK